MSTYPPERHVERDGEKLRAVIERFSLATLISCVDGAPLVTHVPLILDRSRGEHGTLIGHMDRSNPQAQHLDGEPVLAVFHGPNGYISPSVYESSQLPTWNFVAVHAKGVTRRMATQDELIAAFVALSRHADRTPTPRWVEPQDPRIGRLIDFVIGFEIAITSLEGKFKLSQDRDARDRGLVLEAMSRQTESGERAFLERVM